MTLVLEIHKDMWPYLESEDFSVLPPDQNRRLVICLINGFKTCFKKWYDFMRNLLTNVGLCILIVKGSDSCNLSYDA